MLEKEKKGMERELVGYRVRVQELEQALVSSSSENKS